MDDNASGKRIVKNTICHERGPSEAEGPNYVKLSPAWGKYDATTGIHHLLAYHCADVAACLRQLITLPVLRNRLESAAGQKLSDVTIERIAVLGFLHDVGKLHPGFQAKGWPEGIWHFPTRGHVREGAALFLENPPRDMDKLLCVDALTEWGVSPDLLFATLAHHGRPFSMEGDGRQLWEKYRTTASDYDAADESHKLGVLLQKWLPSAFAYTQEQLPDTPQLQHLLCGLIALADWIGSDKRFFPLRDQLDIHYIDTAHIQAHRAVSAVGINVEAFRNTSLTETGFEKVTGFEIPNASQQTLHSYPTDERLLILEAETGAGKTEAAFWRFVRLFEAGTVDSLYFALPTRTSAVQLHERVNGMLKRWLGDKAPEAILAVPGYMKAGQTHGECLPNWQVHWEDEGVASEQILASRWAAESSKRYLAAMVAVGTVDQAMLAGLQVKHAHLRGAALARSLLVIDEVHASDSYMTEVQNNLLRIHGERGGYALLMSATLGARARCRWLNQVMPSFADAITKPYPALWGKRQGDAFGTAAPKKQKTVGISLTETMDAAVCAEIANKAAQCGARVLLIRNTVTAAIATWQAVCETGGKHHLLKAGGEIALHHGRFAPEDRKILDKAVEAALSPHTRTDGGVIVIGTQTLEQSLDIDADVLITDLCPIDVLLQRIGRLHRHTNLARPIGFEKPACHVLTPAKGLEPLLKPSFENGLGAWREKKGTCGIYRDLSILELTRRLVLEYPEWTLPSMNRLLVESAMHEDCINALHHELDKRWQEYRNDVVGDEIANRGAAKLVSLNTAIPFSDPSALFLSDEESVRTRLGAEGARIIFDNPVCGPFGGLITSVILPAHWSYGLDTRDTVNPIVHHDGLRLLVGDKVFDYSRSGLSKGSL